MPITSSPCTSRRSAGARPTRSSSAASLADPTNTKLAGQVATVFKGTTLRGLLLEAYAFWTFGQIALVAAIVSFILAGIMLVLTLFGALHLRRVPEDQEFPRARGGKGAHVPA